MLGQQKEYIAFTIKQSNIEAVDMISGQVWPRFGLPKAPVYDFEAGKLTADDFVLRGLQLMITSSTILIMTGNIRACSSALRLLAIMNTA